MKKKKSKHIDVAEGFKNLSKEVKVATRIVKKSKNPKAIKILDKAITKMLKILEDV